MNSKAYNQLCKLAIAKLNTNKITKENMQAFTVEQLFNIKAYRQSKSIKLERK